MKYKNLHLIISALVLIPIGLAYGISPDISGILHFEIEVIDLKNILRATMGLYLAIAAYWLLGSMNSRYWRSATLINVLFMLGLFFGRILSIVLDGIPSNQFLCGMFLELLLATWGCINLNRFRANANLP